jgi:hypothetical protein
MRSPTHLLSVYPAPIETSGTTVVSTASSECSRPFERVRLARVNSRDHIPLSTPIELAKRSRGGLLLGDSRAKSTSRRRPRIAGSNAESGKVKSTGQAEAMVSKLYIIYTINAHLHERYASHY